MSDEWKHAAAYRRSLANRRASQEAHWRRIESGEARAAFLEHWNTVGLKRWRERDGKWYPCDGFYKVEHDATRSKG